LKYSHVIWDWNGTLLNDVEFCLSVINSMLSKRGLTTLDGILAYHSVFCFPVIDYYKKIGFDFKKEPFEILAVEYIDAYYSGESRCALYGGAEEILREINAKGAGQIILSASEINNLRGQLSRFGIVKYFDEILGISDIYAGSKTEIGLDFIRRGNVKNALLVGDTEHDFQTARALGADCVLIANGHQSREKLLSCGVRVLDDVSEVKELLC
jgi:phosphoglycolate phosphatase